MAFDAPDVLIRRWFEDLWNQGREETIELLIAPQAKLFGLAGGGVAVTGPQEFKPFFRQFRAAFPDITITVDRTVAEADLVVAHCRVTGTHSGDGLGTPATGSKVEFTGMCMARFSGGQVVEAWNSFDFLTCYQQVGLLPQLAV